MEKSFVTSGPVFDFRLKPIHVIVSVDEFQNERVHFRNSEMKVSSMLVTLYLQKQYQRPIWPLKQQVAIQ